MTSKFYPAIILAAAAVAGAAHASNLIVNGDFSSPNESGSWTLASSIPGWVNKNGDQLEVGGNNVYGLPCYSATCQNLEVNANTFDTVSQTVTGLTTGATYTLSWAYGGRPGSGPQALDASFGGTHLTTDTGSYGVWTLNTFTVVATGATETLTFASQNVGGLPGGGNELTAVSLTGAAVPEPAAWALMLMGFTALGGALRSRKRALAAI